MINSKLIYKILGQLLFIEAFLLFVSLLVAFYYQQDDIFAFIVATLTTIGGGLVLKWRGHGADNSMSRRDAYLVVTLSWIVFSFFGTLPFMVSGYINNFTDAYFETMSGFTTTGATILDDVERLPHALLFWRSLSQWIGGLGIVFFTIAILPSLVGGSVKVFAAEATGPVRTKMHPRLSTNAKWICSIYLVLTVACILSYYAAGMEWFDSVNYSMSTTATGGFAPHNDSVEHYHSAAVEYVSLLFQFLSGINFTLLYIVIFKRQLRQLVQNSEFRLYLFVVSFSAIVIMAILIYNNGYGTERAFRCALFQVVSFITTTGLFNDDAGAWPHITWVILGICMFLGACAGSTSGGFKCIRGSMVLKAMQNEFRQILHPSAVLPIKVNGQNVPSSKVATLLAFFALYVVMCLISATIMIAAGIDNTNAITIALSCMSNVGPTLGTEIGPVMSWAGLPDGIKWICSFLMLVGRLEIMSVMVLFTRGFWTDN